MRSIIPILLFILVAGCASTPGQIDTAVDQCCAASAYETVEVRAENIPAFLGPLMVSNFSVAMANRGLQPVVSGADLIAVLRYEQIDLGEQREKDDFAEQLGGDSDQRFIARVAIDIRDAASDEVVFAGHIQRLHDIGAGEWMHTGPASAAIYLAFEEVLEGFRD